ncbi:MAG TPA: FtsX-like permease family protein [Gemmataceae bacterium]|nr:FtsX-like permease family protein [Gemmataceae bacterium]
MRTPDVLRLALGALVQQKVRTLLTMCGVTVGSLVLLLSLSIGVGLREAVFKEIRRHDELRRIEVRPGYGKVEEHIPPQDLVVQGEMSDAKRRRLRDRLVQAWIARHGYPPTSPLTTDRLAEIRTWPHVVSATPQYMEWGRVALDGKFKEVETVSATTGREQRLRARLTAGEWFKADDERSVVVSEYLLYTWGIASDDAVRGAVGRKVTLEYRTGMSRPMMLLSLFNVDPSMVGPEQEAIARKILKNLPLAATQLGLDKDELERLQNMLNGPKREGVFETEQVISEELTIVGVVRGPEKDDPQADSLIDRFRPDSDVVLPVGMAEALYFRNPHHAERGLDFADVTVDSENHVQEVVNRIEAEGLGQFSLADYAQRVWTNLTLLTSAFVVLSLTALMVAALGITNTLVMSVLERRHEIGVMKAVGARDGHILGIFLVEGALIGLLGGCLGLLFGWLASFPLESFAMSVVKRQGELHPDQALFAFPPWLIGGVPLFAMLITTLAALYPARRAARVNPIEALRHD